MDGKICAVSQEVVWIEVDKTAIFATLQNEYIELVSKLLRYKTYWVELPK